MSKCGRLGVTLLLPACAWWPTGVRQASAQEITIERGYVWMYGPNPGLLALTIGGTDGFTLHLDRDRPVLDTFGSRLFRQFGMPFRHLDGHRRAARVEQHPPSILSRRRRPHRPPPTATPITMERRCGAGVGELESCNCRVQPARREARLRHVGRADDTRRLKLGVSSTTFPFKTSK
jgi:hypothetical protein